MTLDELLLEWSYRSEKGYPLVGSPSDVSILKEILTELKLSEEKEKKDSKKEAKELKERFKKLANIIKG
jgi:hypothetical protein